MKKKNNQHKKALAKRELPSKYIAKRMNKIRRDAYNEVSKEHGLTKKEAEDVLTNDPEWNMFLKERERQYSLGMLDLAKDFTQSVKQKMANGSMEQAKSGVVALSIIKDKVFGDGSKKGLTVGGKNVQINLAGWEFKPYKGNKRS